jgi:hypothetical protein
LYDVREFVREQSLARWCARCVLPRTKHYMSSQGEGTGLHRLGQAGCPCICIHAHLAEIMAKTRLEESTCRPGERLITALTAVNMAFQTRVTLASGHAHDLFCYLVGLLFVWVPRLADG